MGLTIAQLQDISLGYLTGADLTQWCSPQLLIKQHIIDANCLARGCNTAYGEAAQALRTKYSTSEELAKIMFTQAQATAQLTAGAVTGINITVAGSNYISAPTVQFTGGGGAGATATAILTNGVVTGFTITAGGAGYTGAPVVTVVGGSGSDNRESVLVKIVSILAVRNILGNFENIGEKMLLDFQWADKMVVAIRRGEGNLLLMSTALYTTDQLNQLYPLNTNSFNNYPGANSGGNQPIQTGPGSIAQVITQDFGTLG